MCRTIVEAVDRGREVEVGVAGSRRKGVGNQDVMKREHVDIGRDIF